MSFVIQLPSFPECVGDFRTSNRERDAFYDILSSALTAKFKYEEAKLKNEQKSNEQYNLGNLKVYSSFLNRTNNEINDKELRSYVLETLKIIKNNNYSKKSVRDTYRNAYKWFSKDNTRGQIFAKNLATGKIHESIDFSELFYMCEEKAITENSPEFSDVVNLYQKYKSEYEDLLR